MTAPTNSFILPDRTNSDFGGGHICWSLLRDVATWVQQGRRIDLLNFAPVLHLKPYAVALAVGAAKRLGSTDLQVIPPQDIAAKNHLIRLGVPAALGVDWGAADVRGSNLPLEIVTQRPSSDFSYHAASLLAEEFPGGLPAGMTARIADSVDEVILNAMAHSESPIGCVIVGQAFPANQCIEVAIVDLGVTIRGHLGRRFAHLATDEQAIREAVKEGVTGTLPGAVNLLGDPNSGIGLSELKDFVEATNGELAILSGSAVVSFGEKTCTQSLVGQRFLGTLISIRFNTGAGAAPPRPAGAVYY